MLKKNRLEKLVSPVERRVYNNFHNIFRLFDDLPSFPFTASEAMRDIIYKHVIHGLPHEFPNDLGLRILGN